LAERTRDCDGKLVALRHRDNQSIEVTVSWRCASNSGAGRIVPPLLIQVDARPTTP
jgi:hypothetical protein